MKTSRTMTEAQRFLRISPPTLYRLINAGKLRTYKVGRRRFTTEKALLECVERLESERGGEA